MGENCANVFIRCRSKSELCVSFDLFFFVLRLVLFLIWAEEPTTAIVNNSVQPTVPLPVGLFPSTATPSRETKNSHTASQPMCDLSCCYATSKVSLKKSRGRTHSRPPCSQRTRLVSPVKMGPLCASHCTDTGPRPHMHRV